MLLNPQLTMAPPYQEDPRAIAVDLPADAMHSFVVEMIRCLEESRSYWRPHHDSMVEDRKLYAAKKRRANKPYPTASELCIPMLVYTQANLLARMRKALFSPNPQFRLTGRILPNSGDRTLATAVENLMQREVGPESGYMDCSNTLQPVLAGQFQDGGNIAYLRWRTTNIQRRRWQMMQRPVGDPMTGEPMMGPMGPLLTPPQLEPTQVNYPLYDNLEIVSVDKDKCDIYPPTAAGIDAADGVAVSITLSGNQLLNQAIAGQFDMQAVQYLRDRYQGDSYTPTTEHVTRNLTGDTGQPMEFTHRPYKLTEAYWQWSPSPGNVLAQIYLITLHEPTQTVLRFRPNPWWHGQIPMVDYAALPGKVGILGRSLPDLIGDPQRGMDFVWQMMMDDLAWKVGPPILTKTGSMSKAEMEVFKRRLTPRSIWEVQYPDLIKPMLNETGVNPQIGLGFIQELQLFANRATSLNDPQAGQKVGRQTTAFEIQNMMASSDVMFSEMADNLARCYEKTGRMILASLEQMANHPTVKRAWEETNGDDPTGMMCMAALSEQYDLASAGGSASANVALRQKQVMELFQFLANNPLANQNLMRMFNATQLVLNEYREVARYPERFIGNEQDAAVQQQQSEINAQIQQALAIQQVQQPGAGGQRPAPQTAAKGGQQP
jgi:hypothetical protein